MGADNSKQNGGEDGVPPPAAAAAGTGRPLSEDELGSCAACNKDLRDTEQYTAALGKYYCVGCFKCDMCSIELAGKPFFPSAASNTAAVCSSCFADQAPTCEACDKPVTEGVSMNVAGRLFHKACFCCSNCSAEFGDERFFTDFKRRKENGKKTNGDDDDDGDVEMKNASSQNANGKKKKDGEEEDEMADLRLVLYCKACNFKDLDNPDALLPCGKCDKPVDGKGFYALGMRWHRKCFVCFDCSRPLYEEADFIGVDEHLYCRNLKCVFIDKNRTGSFSGSPEKWTPRRSHKASAVERRKRSLSPSPAEESSPPPASSAKARGRGHRQKQGGAKKATRSRSRGKSRTAAAPKTPTTRRSSRRVKRRMG